MKRTTRFRLLIEAPEIVVLPGAHDALTLRLAEQAGSQAVTCGGYSATASLLGAPDVQQLTMTEMADMYARLCDATELPLFADGDTGYGQHHINVARTVRAYERAGVAVSLHRRPGIAQALRTYGRQARDPRRRDGGEAEGRPRCPRRRRSHPSAHRTDARAVHGPRRRDRTLPDSTARLRRRPAFADAPISVDELAPRLLGDRRPLLRQPGRGRQDADPPARQLEAMGFAAVTWPVSPATPSARAVAEVYAALLRDGTTNAVRDRMVDFAAFNGLIGLEQVREPESALRRTSARDLLEHPRRPMDGGRLNPGRPSGRRPSARSGLRRHWLLHGKANCPETAAREVGPMTDNSDSCVPTKLQSRTIAWSRCFRRHPRHRRVGAAGGAVARVPHAPASPSANTPAPLPSRCA